MIIKLVFKSNGKIASVTRFEVSQCEVDYIRKSIHYTNIVKLLNDETNRVVCEVVEHKRLTTYADEIYIDNERIVFE